MRTFDSLESAIHSYLTGYRHFSRRRCDDYYALLDDGLVVGKGSREIRLEENARKPGKILLSAWLSDGGETLSYALLELRAEPADGSRVVVGHYFSPFGKENLVRLGYTVVLQRELGKLYGELKSLLDSRSYQAPIERYLKM